MAGSQKFLQQIRAPRVNIEYDVETYGSEKKVSLPFTMGVVSDLSGKSNVPKAKLEERTFVDVDAESIDARMKSIQPRAAFNVPNVITGKGNLAVDLTFESMDDFKPDSVATKIEGLKELVTAREQLSNLLSYMDGKVNAEELITKLLNDPALLHALASQRNSAEKAEDNAGNNGED